MSLMVKKLSNGIPVLLDKIDNVNSISLGVFVKTGARNEYEHESGVSHYIEHMMFKGTTNRSAKDISEEIDNLGGIINAYTSRDTTAYYIQMLSNQIDKGIEVLSDMFLNSTFTEENLEKERNVIIEEIRMYEDIPEEVVHDENIKFALKGIQANSISGTEESLKKIDREIFLNYFKEQYKASNLVISVAGRIKENELLPLLEKGFGSIKDSKEERKLDNSYEIKTGVKKIKKDTNQVHLCFNTRGTSSKGKDKYIMGIIGNVLAGSMSSRLFQKIREERGLAYSVYSYSNSFVEDGLFTIYAGTTKESYQEVIDLIKEEFLDVKNNGITPYELQKSKNQFLSSLTFSLEATKSRMVRMANLYILYGKLVEMDEIVETISNITLEETKELAKKLFDEKYYSWTILGDVE